MNRGAPLEFDSGALVWLLQMKGCLVMGKKHNAFEMLRKKQEYGSADLCRT